MLKILKTLEEQLPLVVDSTKRSNAVKLGSITKGRVDGNNINSVISALIPYYELFNSLGRKTTWIEEMKCSTDEVSILNEFVPFILPSAVLFNPSSDNAIDLLERSKYNDELVYSLEDFDMLQNHIRRWFNRSGREGVTTLSSIRTDKSLSDILPRVIVRDRVSHNGTPFVPLNLKEEGQCMESFFNHYEYSVSAMEILSRYISRMDLSGK